MHAMSRRFLKALLAANILLLCVPGLSGAGIEAGLKSVLHEFKLERLPHHIHAVEVRRQQAAYAGNRSFKSVLKKALICLLKDASDTESPLAIARQAIEDRARTHGDRFTFKGSKDKADALLRQCLLDPNALFALVPMEGKADAYVDRTDTRILRPQGGEKLDKNWLFFVTLPKLSDHTYWVVVGRNSHDKTYVYGFN